MKKSNTDTIDDICELINKTVRAALTPFIERIKTLECRDTIIKNVLYSLPEYNEIVEENLKFKSSKDDVKIVITEKCDKKNFSSKEFNLNTSADFQMHFLDWSNKLEEFIDNLDQNDPIIESLNQLKDEFDSDFATNFKNNYINTINRSEIAEDSSSDSEDNRTSLTK